VHLPRRFFLGRIESTRLHPLIDLAEFTSTRAFRDRLLSLCRERGTSTIHGLAHLPDFWSAFKVARTLGCRYCLSVHDDIAYSAQSRPLLRASLPRLGEAWRQADARLVITAELGEEYSRRYGRRGYSVVTDGLERIASEPRAQPDTGWRLYFMGAFHLTYGPNFTALEAALSQLTRTHPDISLTCRCGAVPPDVWSPGSQVRFLPFGTDDDVEADLTQVDVLYLPLPLDRRHELFTRFSLSTKLVTYLGSGLPIVYHGPADAAAGRLLADHDAAAMVTSLDPAELADVVGGLDPVRRRELAENALRLARLRFRLEDQQQAFRDAVGL